MPPELFDVLDACPEMRSWKTKGRQSEPDLAGLRDRVLLLIGFVGALRRSELVGLDLDHVAEHPNGLVITLARSKTNQTGCVTSSPVRLRPRPIDWTIRSTSGEIPLPQRRSAPEPTSTDDPKTGI